ncbi:MAG: T9SS type A sorting domain-containing protein, partial [Bacteroidia bacterium]|nr:T9SS type A sorting domain-containing protein [Bacteroidia bacterium]
FTGTSLPNNTWGHGKVDAFQVLSNCTPVGIEEHSNSNQLIVVPNPVSTNQEISFVLSKELIGKKLLIDIRSLSGQKLHEQAVSHDLNKIQLSNISAGVYFIRLFADDTLVSSSKLVVID